MCEIGCACVRDIVWVCERESVCVGGWVGGWVGVREREKVCVRVGERER